MNETPRMRQNMEKLLRIARGEADALRVDLSDIERARDTAKTSLAGLEEKMRLEQTAAADPGDLARFLEGARERRLNLNNTIATLEDAEENARRNLETAFIEIKKLEHLLELNDSAARRAASKREGDAMNDVAAAVGRR